MCKITDMTIHYTGTRPRYPEYEVKPYYHDLLIPGLRQFQLATGAHYKLRAILVRLPKPHDVLVCGDGSGGISALCLRMYKSCRVIFNSLMTVDGKNFRGISPSPPAAIKALDPSDRRRCVSMYGSPHQTSGSRLHGTPLPMK